MSSYMNFLDSLAMFITVILATVAGYWVVRAVAALWRESKLP